MLLVIMTRSLIRLDNTVRASLNNDCMTNSHDERQWDDNDDAMTETDSDITRDDRDEIVITKGYGREREGVGTNTNNDDITRGYN
mgnify:CR=1 FL=1